MTSVQDRNKDNDKNRPVNGDSKGRMMVSGGLDGDVYSLFLPPVAVGANKVFFDLFNGTTDKDIEILSVQPIMSGAVAVVGAVAVDVYLTRTTAVGTGGTAATYDAAVLTAPQISRVCLRAQASPTTVTARAVPTGGATGGAVIAFDSLFSEETNSATYNRVNLIKDNWLGTRITCTPGTGIRVIQGAVASVGNLGFQVLFSLVKPT